MSSSSQTPESWIAAFCSLIGHEYFAEVSEDFIEDDFNLTGLQSQVPMYKEALEMILDVEPEDVSDEDEDEEEEEDDDDDEMQDGPDGAGRGYRRGADAAAAAAERRHLRLASDLSVIESSAEMLYGLIHQRFITSRPGIQQMAEKYELGHFGHCPRVNCYGAKVLPVGCSDIPGQETVKLFCPSCLDVYTPPNSRFQTVDGAFFGTTFGCLFFMTFPELDVGGTKPPPQVEASSKSTSPLGTTQNSASNSLDSKNTKTSASSPLTSHPATANQPQSPPHTTHPAPSEPESINGTSTKNLAPGLGPGNIYEPKIYGFRVSEIAKTGPRMKWLRSRPMDISELDESRIWTQSHDPTTNHTAKNQAEVGGDAEMADHAEEIDGGEVEDEDMDGAAAALPDGKGDGEVEVDGEDEEEEDDIAEDDAARAQVRDVAHRKKQGRRRNNNLDGSADANANSAMVNGNSTGGTAVRVGDGG